MNDDPAFGAPAFTVLASNRWFIVGEDEEGYGIWSVADEGDVPLRRFPLTDAGSESVFDEFASMSRARRRSPVRGALLWTAALSGLVWVFSNGYVSIEAALELGFTSERGASMYRWLGQISATAYPVFVVSTGLYVMLWLSSRDARS